MLHFQILFNNFDGNVEMNIEIYVNYSIAVCTKYKKTALSGKYGHTYLSQMSQIPGSTEISIPKSRQTPTSLGIKLKHLLQSYAFITASHCQSSVVKHDVNFLLFFRNSKTVLRPSQ